MSQSQTISAVDSAKGGRQRGDRQGPGNRFPEHDCIGLRSQDLLLYTGICSWRLVAMAVTFTGAAAVQEYIEYSIIIINRRHLQISSMCALSRTVGCCISRVALEPIQKTQNKWRGTELYNVEESDRIDLGVSCQRYSKQ